MEEFFDHKYSWTKLSIASFDETLNQEAFSNYHNNQWSCDNSAIWNSVQNKSLSSPNISLILFFKLQKMLILWNVQNPGTNKLPILQQRTSIVSASSIGCTLWFNFEWTLIELIFGFIFATQFYKK